MRVAPHGDYSSVSSYVACQAHRGRRKEAEKKLAYHAQLLEHVHDAVFASDERFVSGAAQVPHPITRAIRACS